MGMKFKGSRIACPKHGWLPGPYEITKCIIGRSIVDRIQCAFCSVCNCYYSTAMVLYLSGAEPIRGISVRLGTVQAPETSVIQSTEDAIERPVLEHTYTKGKKKKIVKERNSHHVAIQSQPNEARNKLIVKMYNQTISQSPKKEEAISHEKKTSNFIVAEKKDASPTHNSYVISSNVYSLDHWTCPDCNSRLQIRITNIPIFSEKDIFIGYYVEDLKHCDKCNRSYLSTTMLNSLMSRINNGNLAENNIIKPLNGKVTKKPNSNDYLFAPISDNAAFVDQKAKDRNQEAYSNIIAESSLSTESFLRKMDYTSKHSTADRQKILLKAVQEFGRRKVVDHLLFLIRTREGQTNGKEKYALSISAWKDDVEFLTSDHLHRAK